MESSHRHPGPARESSHRHGRQVSEQHLHGTSYHYFFRAKADSSKTSQGLGYSTVKWLALAGAKVYMGSRSETRGQEAIEALRRESPEIKEGTVVLLKLELASIKGIIAAADEVKKKETRLDILGLFGSRF